ncbi:hypothetical protein EIP91_012091 [Steccherinum ochraceum]|uniref:Uncharacterized protein n=1 Tax=Steccherinum ochraceum TaxID=92696 RepID=A0A4R0RUD5_9APHY|nr:hypothetical protein EIP91_012091 [Steccherinum ochraceum]
MGKSLREAASDLWEALVLSSRSSGPSAQHMRRRRDWDVGGEYEMDHYRGLDDDRRLVLVEEVLVHGMTHASGFFTDVYYGTLALWNAIADGRRNVCYSCVVAWQRSVGLWLGASVCGLVLCSALTTASGVRARGDTVTGLERAGAESDASRGESTERAAAGRAGSEEKQDGRGAPAKQRESEPRRAIFGRQPPRACSTSYKVPASSASPFSPPSFSTTISLSSRCCPLRFRLSTLLFPRAIVMKFNRSSFLLATLASSSSFKALAAPTESRNQQQGVVARGLPDTGAVTGALSGLPVPAGLPGLPGGAPKGGSQSPPQSQPQARDLKARDALLDGVLGILDSLGLQPVDALLRPLLAKLALASNSGAAAASTPLSAAQVDQVRSLALSLANNLSETGLGQNATGSTAGDNSTSSATPSASAAADDSAPNFDALAELAAVPPLPVPVPSLPVPLPIAPPGGLPVPVPALPTGVLPPVPISAPALPTGALPLSPPIPGAPPNTPNPPPSSGSPAPPSAAALPVGLPAGVPALPVPNVPLPLPVHPGAPTPPGAPAPPAPPAGAPAPPAPPAGAPAPPSPPAGAPAPPSPPAGAPAPPAPPAPGAPPS